MLRRVPSRLILPLLAAFTLLAAAQAPSRLPPPGHPILGKWQWTRAENQCTEVYDFRADGTVPVVSGEERTENTFTISDAPNEDGFYTLTMFTVKDHGGRDCGDDDSDNTSMENVLYVLFEPKRTEFIVCSEPALRGCFGPLRRVPK